MRNIKPFLRERLLPLRREADEVIYEEKKKKKRRHPFRRALMKALLSLVMIAALLAGIVAGGMYIAPMSLLLINPQQEMDIYSELPVSHMNILLLGVDSENHGQRSDSMMVLSVGDGDLALTSLMRDMVVEIPGHGKTKLNAAYSYGGAQLTMQTVNRNFEMNICKYVQVDYLGLVHAVDALGGICVQITQQEMEKINSLVAAKEERLKQDGYWIEPLTEYGENTRLNGVQTLAYTRIRKLDSDYNRTGRQRQVLQAMWERLCSGGFSLRTAAGLWDVIENDVDTNLTWPEIMMLGVKALKAGGIDMHRLPAAGTFKDDGSKITIDPQANAAQLHRWIYGE